MTMPTSSTEILNKFEYKTLDTIHGEPSMDSLLRVYRQLKRNAQRVRTTLGGGDMGIWDWS